MMKNLLIVFAYIYLSSPSFAYMNKTDDSRNAFALMMKYFKISSEKRVDYYDKRYRFISQLLRDLKKEHPQFTYFGNIQRFPESDYQKRHRNIYPFTDLGVRIDVSSYRDDFEAQKEKKKAFLKKTLDLFGDCPQSQTLSLSKSKTPEDLKKISTRWSFSLKEEDANDNYACKRNVVSFLRSLDIDRIELVDRNDYSSELNITFISRKLQNMQAIRSLMLTQPDLSFLADDLKLSDHEARKKEYIPLTNIKIRKIDEKSISLRLYLNWDHSMPGAPPRKFHDWKFEVTHKPHSWTFEEQYYHEFSYKLVTESGDALPKQKTIKYFEF